MNNSLNLITENLFTNKGINSNISVIVSGAEQIGSSWFTLNLGYALHNHKKKILIIDGNGGFSNFETLLMFNNPFFIEEYIKGKKPLNQLINAYKYKNFNILMARFGQNYLADQPQGRVQIFADDIRIFSQNYDQTFIDIGTNYELKNLGLCQIAKNILILCSDTNTDIVKTFDLIRFFNEIGIISNYYLIINKVSSFEDGYKAYERLNKASKRYGLKCPNLLGIVRLDARIRETIRNKELLLTQYPQSEAAMDIELITKKLFEEILNEKRCKI